MSYLNFVALIVLFLIGICGIVGNSLLIWTFNSDIRKSLHFNGLTITLAIYDILSILGFFWNAINSELILPKYFCLPWHCRTIHPSDHPDNDCPDDPESEDKNEKEENFFHRAFLLPAIYVVVIGSIFTTVALSLERYLTIHQYRYEITMFKNYFLKCLILKHCKDY